MFITILYESNGTILGVYKEQAPKRPAPRLLKRGNTKVGVVLKANGPLGSLQAYEIKKQFRVADVPKEGFVVLERIKDA